MLYDEITMQSPNPSEIKCKNCKFRDRTFIKIGDKTKFVGITRGTCLKYKGLPEGKCKPNEVLFMNSECEYYEKDKEEK